MNFFIFFHRAENIAGTRKETQISMGEDDAFDHEKTVGKTTPLTPLSAVADAFEPLSALVKSRDVDFDLSLKPFCEACSLVSVLFGCLGIAFKFAHSEYVSKVSYLLFLKYIDFLLLLFFFLLKSMVLFVFGY